MDATDRAKDSTTLISHSSLPVSAPRAFWSALGWTVYDNITTAGGHPIYGIDETLAIAVAEGLSGEAALARAVAEKRRRGDVAAVIAAVNRETEAIQSLATAINQSQANATLENILGRLTDATRWAVRKQLAGTGLPAAK